MTKDDQIKGMAQPQRGSVGLQEARPVAWMRKWAFDGETPTKSLNENNRISWPFKYKLMPVTQQQCLVDDVPLYPPTHPNHIPDATKMVKPMTDEEIRKMWHKEHKWHKSLSSFEWYMAGVKAAIKEGS